MFCSFEHKDRIKQVLYKTILVYQLIFVVIFLSVISLNIACAELKSLSENDLKSSTGQAGLTEFTMSNNTARLFVDIHIETYTTIDRLAAGYFQRTGDTSKGWDLNWQNISLGSSKTAPLIVDGLVFIADFDNSTGTNTLQRVVFGSNYINGAISANFSSYVGMYNDALLGNPSNPVICSGRTNLGQRTFNFTSNGTTNMGLYFILNMSTSGPAVQVVAGYDDKTIKANPPSSTTVWWKSP